MKSGPALVKWPVLGVAVVWIAAFGWRELVRPDPHADMRATRNQAKLEQKIKDCRGNYSQRYDCKSAHIREHDVREFNRWAKKLGLVFAPPLALFAFYIGFIIIRERKAEAGRRARRVKRIEKEKEDSRIRAIEEGKRRTEEARKKAEEKKREKEERKREKEGKPKAETPAKEPELFPAKAPVQASAKEPEQAAAKASKQASAKAPGTGPSEGTGTGFGEGTGTGPGEGNGTGPGEGTGTGPGEGTGTGPGEGTGTGPGEGTGTGFGEGTGTSKRQERTRGAEYCLSTTTGRQSRR